METAIVVYPLAAWQMEQSPHKAPLSAGSSHYLAVNWPPRRAARGRGTLPWQPQMGSGQIPDFPVGLSSAVLQLTNFTSVLHWLHTCNCTLSWVWGLIWPKSNVEKGHWRKREGERQSAQQHKLWRNSAGQGAQPLLKVTGGRLSSPFCKKPSPSASLYGWGRFPTHGI